MKYLRALLLLCVLIFQSCIQDDIIDDRVDESLSFNNPITELTIKDTHQYVIKYTNNVGEIVTPTINWSSSNDNVISVSNTGLLTALSIGEATITATATTEEATVVNEVTIEVKPAEEQLVIDNVIQEIIINNTHQYTTTYTNSLNEVEVLPVTWTSSDNAVLSVSNNGLITGVTTGQATIMATATTSTGKTLTFEDEVTVTTVAERLTINNPINQINITDTYQYTTTYTDNSGQVQSPTVTWSSSNTSILSINTNGLLTAVGEGEATITATVTNTAGQTITAENTITVIGNSTEKTGTIRTTSSYTLRGTFTLREIPGTNNLELIINDDYAASSSLPGLYLYLTNNPNTINNALEVSPVSVFNGSHTYVIENTDINDFSYLLYWCKPFSVKVGDAEIN
ncbi:Ig-like domain-containing protein [Tenacibaculum amylolyticum]|uniref:Ig-like domain-containing protein n=1 Tax=Tenacibaculum amylolyticum TaxID=104269 RepID=UPI003893ADDE